MLAMTRQAQLDQAAYGADLGRFKEDCDQNVARTRATPTFNAEKDMAAREATTSTSTPDLSKADETDFLVTFASSSARSPHALSKARKWVVVIILSLTSLMVACTSSLYTATYAQLEADLHTTRITSTLGLSFFVVGFSLGPMLLAPLSELFGRKVVYVVSLAAFSVLMVPCAVTSSVDTLLAFRFLDGFAGSAFLSVAGGSVGDLFEASELSMPMMVYTASPFLGPQIGPIIGGFVNYHLHWRWSFYILLIWAAVQWILVCLFVPETYHPVLLRKEAIRLRRETGDDRYYAAMEKNQRSMAQVVVRSGYRPFLLLCLEPMCLLLCLFTAVLLGVMYLFFGAFNMVFHENHGFNLWQVGLSFTGIAVGMMLGLCSGPLHYLELRRRHAASCAGDEIVRAEPEFRLPPAIGGAPLVTGGLFMFAWTTYAHVPWIVPILASTIFGAGVIMVFSGVFTFLVDAYPLYAASALAANSFLRNMFAAAFPLFGPAMYRNLGFQWASCVLAFITLVLAPFPYIFYKKGSQIRQYSRYAGQR